MKNFRKIYCLLLLLAVLSLPAFAQEVKDLKLPIPTDPSVRTGKLANGLTYYLRKNAKPEKRVELRLAVNAGSIQEAADQVGLAHFTEHMAFNGSKNFPKNDLVKYLQTIGSRFGPDINAYTSFDETVYMLQLPTDSAEALNKGFQVLEDWGHQLAFDNKEIDKERGVIIEEWRGGRGANQRMRDKYFPLLFKGSKYANNNIIGTKEVLETFKYESIKRFYKEWYRPDLMAVVVVGDMELDEMEKKVKQHFSKMKAADKKAPKRELENIPDHKETYISIVQDKEATNTQVQVLYKHPVESLKTLQDLRQRMLRSLYNGMMSMRLEELRQKAEPPFIFANSVYTNYIRSKDVYFTSAVVSESGAEKGLKTILEENQRVKKFGFTQGELDRYKKVLLKRYEQQLNERNKTESAMYTYEYVDLFLEGSASPGIEYEYTFFKEHLPSATLEEINALSKKWITNENRVVIITAPEKETVKLPTEERVKAILMEAGTASLKPYEDKAVASSLMEKAPTAGKITNENKIEALNVTELTLSNGVKVILKPTDFKNDEILFTAFSNGGSSLYSDEDMYSAQYASQIVGQSGVANFGMTDMMKMMSGKTVRISPSIGTLSENLGGNFSPADIETAFQTMHLYFTQPRKDEEAFKSFISKGKAQWQNMMANPQFFYIGEINKLLANNHPRGGLLPKPEDYDKINYDRAFQIYKERFADASDFTFVFVGNFQVDKIKTLLETYLGSLPATNRKETWKDLGVRPPKGIVEKDFLKGGEGKSVVSMIFTGETEYSRKEAYALASVVELLNIKLIEAVREEQGGAYSVGAFGGLSKNPYNSYSVQVQFPCNSERVDELTKVALGEIQKIQDAGATPEDLQKVKETQKRQREINVKENRYWLGQLQSYYNQGEDPTQLLNAEKATEGLTSKSLQDAAKKYFNMKNYIKAVLKPEK